MFAECLLLMGMVAVPSESKGEARILGREERIEDLVDLSKGVWLWGFIYPSSNNPGI